MKDLSQSISRLYAAGEMVTISTPQLGRDMSIVLMRDQIKDAMERWTLYDRSKRRRVFASVKSHIAMYSKQAASGAADQRTMNALAADLCLWIGHELAFSDGEKYLLKGPPSSELDAAIAKLKSN